MQPASSTENFVTLFDSNFLPAGISLHGSLVRHSQPFRLWILCMDELVEERLRQLALPHVELIPLREAENAELLGVKGGRTRTEYCWTLTPFTPAFVMARDPSVTRVTYIDADLFFFQSPGILLGEFEQSGKDVMITEHAYAPEYDRSKKSGTFCVQFMTFRATPGSMKVMRWWQERCIEWCFYRYEDGKIGDQMYLQDWPVRFAGEVHVLQAKEYALAPWNARYYAGRFGELVPVFYHFHGYRILSSTEIRWYQGYRIGGYAEGWYAEYSESIVRSIKAIFSQWGAVPTINDEMSLKQRLRKAYYVMAGSCRYYRYSLGPRGGSPA